MARCTHTWEWLGETRESLWEWCEECGAIRRTRDGVKVFLTKRQQRSK